MPSTYSPNLRIELIATGEQSGTWGATTNTNLGTLIEDAVAGYTSVSITSANQALTALNGAADQSRNMTIALSTTTSAAFNVYIPPAEKFYVIRNLSAYDASIYCSTVLGNTTAAGTGVTVKAGTTFQVCTDGTNVYEALNSFSGALTVTGSLTVNGNSTLGSTRLSATYSQSTTTVTVTTTTAHGYTTGNSIQFIPTSGDAQGGQYTITVTGTTSFTFTSALSQTTSGDALVTNDTVTVNGVVQPGVVISSTSGSTFPALRITQTGTGNALVVEDDTNPDSTPFIVNTDGRVITGATQAYTNYLDGFGGTARNPNVQFNGTSLSTASSSLTNWANADSPPLLVLAKSKSGTVGTMASTFSVGDVAGAIQFSASDNTNFVPTALIEAQIDGTTGSGDMPGSLVFSTTADGGSIPTERVRISSDGRLQINGENGLTSSLVATANNFPLASASTAYQFRAEATFDAANTSAVGFGSTYQLPATGAFSSSYQFYAGTIPALTGTTTLTNNYGLYVAAQTAAATNTYGVYSNIAAASNRWNFYANGTADNYFAGNVGIGTSSPSARLNIVDATSQDALRITQTGTGNALVVEDSANPDSSPFVIDTAGNIISGYTSVPTIGTVATSGLNMIGTSADVGQGAVLQARYDNSSTGVRPTFYKSRSTDPGQSRVSVQSGDTIASLEFYGDDGSIGNTGVEAARITAAIDGTPGTDSMPGRLVFSTSDTATTGNPKERMRIDSAGQVGIGTDSPDVQLQVIGSTGTVKLGTSTTNATTKYWRLLGQHYTSGEEGVAMVIGSSSSSNNTVSIGGGSSAGNAATVVSFWTAADTTTVAGTERMRINSSGDVGIGTTSPAHRLSIYSPDAGDNLSLLNLAASATATGGNAAQLTFIAASNNITMNLGASDALVISNEGTEATRVTSSGEFLVGGNTELNSVSGSIVVQRTGASPYINLFRDDTSVVSANALGEIRFYGNDTTTNTPTELATITGVASGTHAAGDNPTDLTFQITPDNTATVTEGMRLTQAKNLKIGGTATRATTEGTNQLVMFNGTAPVGTLANGVSFYSASGEARVMDAAGNSTLLSPHDHDTNEWIFHSKHTPTGKVLRIDVEKMLRFINDHFGLDMIQEFTEE